MARSDLLLNLVRARKRGDDGLFFKTVEAIIAEERSKKHHVFAEQLLTELNKPSVTHSVTFVSGPTKSSGFIQEKVPQKSLEDLVLSSDQLKIVSELIEEHQRIELLRSYNLEPRNKVLLVGPPGNGKTSLAEAVAEALAVPLMTVRYESVIGSFLGETAGRLKQVFDQVKSQRCVLFFDEFDTIGKERGDSNETGEIKRVVSSLLLQLDSVPSHVIVIAASNHSELLDRAAWRRFQMFVSMPSPTQEQITEWICRFCANARVESNKGFVRNVAKCLKGLSYGEVENVMLNAMRRYVLSLPDADFKSLLEQQLDKLPTKP